MTLLSKVLSYLLAFFALANALQALRYLLPHRRVMAAAVRA
jgi:hypothetical protein